MKNTGRSTNQVLTFHIISYCYTCEIHKKLGTTKMVHYETKSGMKAKWINIHEAIAHNKKTMANSNKKGMFIERESFLLELLAEDLD